MKQLVLTADFAHLDGSAVGAIAFHKGRSQYVRDTDAPIAAAAVNTAFAERDAESGAIIGEVPTVVTVEPAAMHAVASAVAAVAGQDAAEDPDAQARAFGADATAYDAVDDE